MYCPRNPNLSRQNCVTITKNPKDPMFSKLWGSGSSPDLSPDLHSLKHIGFFGLFGTVTRFWQERLGFFGQYSIFAYFCWKTLIFHMKINAVSSVDTWLAGCSRCVLRKVRFSWGFQWFSANPIAMETMQSFRFLFDISESSVSNSEPINIYISHYICTERVYKTFLRMCPGNGVLAFVLQVSSQEDAQF